MATVTRRDFVAGAISLVIATGCTTLPGANVVYSGARAVGGAAGRVLKACNLSEKSASVIVEVVGKIVEIVPDVGQSAEDAWGAAAKKHVALLIAEGKCTELRGAIALAAFTILVAAYNILEARYPAALAVRKVAEAAVDGFGKGLLATLSDDATASQAYDEEAYGSMKASTLVSVVRMLAKIEKEGDNGQGEG